MATLCFVKVRYIFSVNEWTYGTVTTPDDAITAVKRNAKIETRYVKGVPFVCRMYTKGVPFLSKILCKR